MFIQSRTVPIVLLLLLLAVAEARDSIHINPLAKTLPKLEAMHRLTLNEAISKHAKAFGIDERIAHTIAAVESNHNMNARRREPGADGYARTLTSDPQEIKRLASAHCAFQVLATTAHGKGVSVAELYDPETCAMMGLWYWAKCRDLKCSRWDSRTECAYKTAQCYNGGPGSKSAKAKQYARRFVRRYMGER